MVSSMPYCKILDEIKITRAFYDFVLDTQTMKEKNTFYVYL